jgi:hypothetical protein
MKKATLIAGAALWIGTIVASFGALERYSLQAGPTGAPAVGAAAWLRAHQQGQRPLLALVIHPLCPCTDASLAELHDFMVRSEGRCDILIVQVSDSAALDVGETIAGTTISSVRDRDGSIARLLGARTSGDSILVDAQGRLRFHGGITISRGHRGESPAQLALLELVEGRSNALCVSPVYGCSLADPALRRQP